MNQSDNKQDSCGHVGIKTPRATCYNPLEADEGVGPLFWELLRRHPGFRFRHRHLASVLHKEQLDFIPPKKTKTRFGEQHGASGHPDTKAAPRHTKRFRLRKPQALVSRYVFQLATWNPLAALVLAWSFRGRPFELRWPTPEAWCGIGFADSDHGRKLQVLQLTQSSPRWTELYMQVVNGPDDGPMNAVSPKTENTILDTAWNKLPIRFRAYFAWLAEEYDHRLNWAREHIVGLDGLGWWPAPGLYDPQVDWSFISDVLDAPRDPHRSRPPFIPSFELETLADTCAAYHLFLIPKQIPSEVEVNQLKRDFESTLGRLFSTNKGLAVRHQRASLYGAKTDWKALDFCRARIEYTRDLPQACGQTSRNISRGYRPFKDEYDEVYKALEYALAKPGKPPSNRQTDLKNRYQRMEAEMMMTFPRLSLEPHLTKQLQLDPEVVRRFGDRARKVAGLKLYHLVVAPMSDYGRALRS